MNLEKMAEKYRDAGYSERNADARVCQDIVLKAIARSNLGRNVTIKGGVVMRSITGNVRRATKTLIWILSSIHWKMNPSDILFQN